MGCTEEGKRRRWRLLWYDWGREGLPAARSATDFSKAPALKRPVRRISRRFSHSFCTVMPFNPSFIFSLGSLTSSRSTLRARHLFWWYLCLCLSCSAPFPDAPRHTNRPVSEKGIPCSTVLSLSRPLRASFAGVGVHSSSCFMVLPLSRRRLCDSWTPSSRRVDSSD